MKYKMKIDETYEILYSKTFDGGAKVHDYYNGYVALSSYQTNKLNIYRLSDDFLTLTDTGVSISVNDYYRSSNCSIFV